MSKKKIYPTQEIIKERLRYNYDTGEFIRISGEYKGYIAGYKDSKGYVRIKIGRIVYFAHILVWIYEYGIQPTLYIDHKDKNKSNNRLDNLRLATATQNNANKVCFNRYGVKGVWQAKSKKWYAIIQINKKPTRYGPYLTIEEAHNRYMKEACKLFGEFASNGVI